MSKLVIVRHGQSVWNLENRFTGSTDIDLTAQGRHEAEITGERLKNIHFSACFVSALKRAKETLDIILSVIGKEHLPVYESAALNERIYGDLQGLNKADTAEKYGAQQVALWRRSFDIAPPNGESLKDTQVRVLKYYHEEIEPHLRHGENILVVAHGNSLRALMMYLEDISKDAIAEVDILTCVPRLYELDEHMKILKAENLT
ncbi:2,3-bisphosphoglycerate-dependent phosphoglycerate mutase [Pedobacter sp. HMF7647]|uniref:2,3-bisphosphoglycerate-dependent phosphoglycerate mutase n=1 Tax=Hufsiella arboris TaxID=2695275 RepID=A0A7K1YBW9_9SPHI|nr:2,3-bisphosphoglycerate-dependent phosphoglycerate mutase [Hufsiella arboris]MXV52065.1 2,3-bisphosphoglycerate-dependent phosphoglycerate mutase [Hufsiella arboris]